MNKSNNYLLALTVSSVIIGIVEVIDDPVDLSVVHAVLIAFFVFAWCKEHALEHNLNSTRGYRLFSALIPVIGVPVYFFRFFGSKEGGVKVLKATLFL